MSGDVQPRKRKDKKRKKDDLGVEEPRGTAAALGEGDVFMHSQSEHGTGGHWCAKVIFFSLLAVLITLIGLIILENRGLSELEANSVESRYSGVLEGWIEDAPDDDHHDEHTLELTHHDDDDHLEKDGQLEDEDHNLGDEHDEDEDHDEDEEHEDDEDEDNADSDEDNDDDENNADSDEDNMLSNENQEIDDEDDMNSDENQEIDDEDDMNSDENGEDDEDNLQSDEDNDEDEDNVEIGDKEDEDSQEHDLQDNEDESDNERETYYHRNEEDVENEVDENENVQEFESNENDDDEYDKDENEDEEEHEEEDIDEEVEVEKLEKEDPNEEPISTELPALPEDDDDDDDDKAETDKDALFETESAQDDDDDDVEEDEEFLETDDFDEPAIERITSPPGKPLVEVEEEVSSEQPPDTLAEEEEYEKHQEELRRQEEESSQNMWLKLSVGGALLAATHAVMRRATRERDSPDREEPASREETPLTDRRLTLIAEEQPIPVPVKKVQEILQPKVDKRVESIPVPIVMPTLVRKQESEDDEYKYSDEEEIQEITIPKVDKELYSDEEEAAEEQEEEVVEEPKQVAKQSAPVVESKPVKLPEPEEEIEEDDVEIIDDEQLDEELEEEDEEEISDVDDAELLTRLEAKYGRLPEPERPGQKFYKDGGNSIDDDWPGEPSDAYWRSQLDSAERELRQGAWAAAIERTTAGPLRDSARARWLEARALDHAAEAQRDNKLLGRAIAAYLELLKINERLSDKKLLEIAARTLDRIQFRGTYLNAEPVYRLLIRRFPNDPVYRNNLTISFLMANRVDLAEDALKETLKLWPNDRLALAHYGFVLKTRHNLYEEAAEAFRKALDGDSGPANEARFYYHYGDSLLLLGRHSEAHEVHKRGTALGHFLSPAQRSLYNVPRLKSFPWWRIEDTPYTNLAKALEKSWKEILKEAEAAKASYEKEKEGLKERGEWSQLDLFVRGREIPDRCKHAPVTCAIVKSEAAAAGCRRGQVKFSAMSAGTHVRPHVGPTNCRLRMHLGLSNTKDTYIRVDQEIRQWQVGKTLMFDDSFEHEVWHNGTGARLVLIVDVWHPGLTTQERRQLPAI